MAADPAYLGEPVPSARPRTRAWAWVIALAGYAVLFAAITHPLWSGKVSAIFDGDSFYAPYHMLLGDFLRAGRLLLWNPWANSGSPDYADPQLGMLSPVTMLFAWIGGGTELGFRAYWLFLWFLSGAGALLLARHMGAPSWGGTVVALGIAFSGFATGHAEHTSQLYAFAFVPLVMWRWDVALLRRSWRAAAEAGALWGLSAVGGYPSIPIGTAALAGLWTVGRIAFADPQASLGAAAVPPAARWRAAALLFAVMLGVGLLVLGPNYLAFMHEMAGFSDRSSALPRALAVYSNSLHPGTISTVASPFLAMQKLLGRPDLWAETDVSSASLYMGAAIPVFAVLALVHGRRHPWRWWLAGLAAFFVAFAMSRALPLRGWAYDALAPMRFFRHASFFRAFTIVAVGALAILGMRDLARDGRDAASPVWRELAWVSTAVGSLALFAYFSVATVGGDLQRLATSHAMAMWLGLAAVCWAGAVRPPVRRTALVVFCVLAGVDAACTAALSAPILYDARPQKRDSWRRLEAAHVRSLDLRPRGLGRAQRTPVGIDSSTDPNNNKNFTIKLPVVDSYTGIRNHLYFDLRDSPLLSATALGPDRMWYAPSAPTLLPSDGNYAPFKARIQELGAPVLVLHTPSDMVRRDLQKQPGPTPEVVRQLRELSPARSLPVQLLEYGPSDLRFRAVAPAAGWLLVTDRWSRGWRATNDGLPADVMGGNFLFRALRVHEGSNDIAFEYHPYGLPWLFAVSWATLFLVAMASATAAGRRKAGRNA